VAKKLGKLATRYARALMRSVRERVSETEQMQVVISDLLASLLEIVEIQELREFVINPGFPTHVRRRALDKVLAYVQHNELAANYVRVVFDRGRIADLPEIVERFSELADRTLGVVRVAVTTARALGDDDKQEIKSCLAQNVKGQLVFSWKIDQSIIGGLIVEYGGVLINGSLSYRLTELQRSLVG